MNLTEKFSLYNENGELHNTDGPAVQWDDGSKFWYINGKQHREDGPAIEYSSGNKYWYINGEYHREDGPAIEYYNGNKAWYYYGKFTDCSSQEEFERIIKLRIFW